MSESSIHGGGIANSMEEENESHDESESDIDDEEFERQKQLLLEQRRLENEMLEKNRMLMKLLKEQEDKLSQRLAEEAAAKEKAEELDSGSESESESESEEPGEDVNNENAKDIIWYESNRLLHGLRIFILANLFVFVFLYTVIVANNDIKNDRETFWSPLRRFIFAKKKGAKPNIFPPVRVLTAISFGLMMNTAVMFLSKDQFLFGVHDAMVLEEMKPNTDVISYPVHLAFQNIGCRPTGTKTPISNVSGVIRPGRITAVIGPSGAGKSTLSQFFLGRGETRCAAHSKGAVFLNGKMRSLNVILDRVGLVPQRDALLEHLTVEEMLLFSATWKLPKRYTLEDRMKALNDTIEMLDLQKVRKNMIGGLAKRGISGGERKRVSIAVELIARPSVLIMDEPTSGLDSVGAFSLMKLLRRIADNGMSVVVALHVPSERIYNLFDDLILLQHGEEIYVGPREEVQEAVEEMGFMPPTELSGTHEHITMPEFLVDILAGEAGYPEHFCPYDLYVRDLFQNGIAPSINCGNRTTLPRWWRNHGGRHLMESVEAELTQLRENEEFYGEETDDCLVDTESCMVEKDLRTSSRDLVEKCNVFLPRPTLRTFCLIANGIIRQPPYPRLPKPGLLVQAANWFRVIWKETLRSSRFASQLLCAVLLGGATGWIRSYSTSWDERVVGCICLSISVSAFGAFSAVFMDDIEPVKRACEGGAVLMSHHCGMLFFEIFFGWVASMVYVSQFYVVLWIRHPKYENIPTLRRFLEFSYLVFIYYETSFAMGWLACVQGKHNFTVASLIIIFTLNFWHIFARFSPNHRQIDLDSGIYGTKYSFSSVVHFLCSLSPSRYFVEAAFMWDSIPEKSLKQSSRTFTMRYFDFRDERLSTCVSFLVLFWIAYVSTRFWFFAFKNSTDFHDINEAPLIGMFLLKSYACQTMVLFVAILLSNKTLLESELEKDAKQLTNM